MCVGVFHRRYAVARQPSKCRAQRFGEARTRRTRDSTVQPRRHFKQQTIGRARIQIAPDGSARRFVRIVADAHAPECERIERRSVSRSVF